jgi:hypothetical protein
MSIEQIYQNAWFTASLAMLHMPRHTSTEAFFSELVDGLAKLDEIKIYLKQYNLYQQND